MHSYIEETYVLEQNIVDLIPRMTRRGIGSCFYFLSLSEKLPALRFGNDKVFKYFMFLKT